MRTSSNKIAARGGEVEIRVIYRPAPGDDDVDLVEVLARRVAARLADELGLREPRPVADADAILSADEAAALAGVTPRTLRRWIASGRLRAGRTHVAGSGRVRVRRADVLEAIGLGGDTRNPRQR